MYGITLIFVLVVMGGAIAYIGDKLGTKVGKKKLTIFGLRPKHTSILVTIITGILIAGTTLGVLSLTSRDVRTALFGMDELKTQLTFLSKEVKDKSAELDANRLELETKTKEYASLSAKVKETADKLSNITAELNSVAMERDRVTNALNSIQLDFAQARGDLEKSKAEIQALEVTKAQLDSRVAVLNEAKETLQADVNKLNELTNNLKQGIQVVREGVVVFRAGEVLGTVVVEGGSGKSDAEARLGNIIYNANQMLLQKLNVSNKELEVLWISKAEFEDAVSLISSTPQAIVVRLSAANNTIYGEPIIGKIELFPNRMVYSQGTVIYSEKLDGPQSSQQAEQMVLAFLQTVNNKSVEQGLLPDPLQGTVGEISGAQLYDTINKVKKYSGSKIEISATAKNDIYTVGPLRVDIKVRALQ